MSGTVIQIEKPAHQLGACVLLTANVECSSVQTARAAILTPAHALIIFVLSENVPRDLWRDKFPILHVKYLCAGATCQSRP